MRYGALEEKYTKQGAQRMNDKATVDEAYEWYLAMESDRDELKAKLKTSQDQYDNAEQQYKAQLGANDREFAQLEDKQQCAMSVIEGIHKKELSAKGAMIEEAKALAREKDDELDAATRKATENLHKVTKASESKRQAWKAEKKELEFKMKRMDADSRDTIQQQQDEIERLMKVKRRLKKEVDLLSASIHGQYSDVEQVVAESNAMRNELDKLRTRNTVLEEKIENTLESMQQERDHWDREYEKEKKARTQVDDLQQKVAELEEKLDRRDEVLRSLEKGIDSKETSTTAQLTQESVSCVGGISQLVFENDELRNQVKAIREKKAEIQSQANKLDDENLNQALRIENTEKQLHEQSIEIELLRKYRASSETELEFLSNAYDQDHRFSDRDQMQLRKHLRETTEQIQAVTKQNSEMQEELTQHRALIKVVQDESDTAVRKAMNWADYCWLQYYDEAVPKVEALYKEIIELNAELGRDIQPKEELVRNQRVIDRSALRFACAETLSGVDTEKFPAEYYGPGFCPGRIPATNDALRVLRPLGWVPVYDAKKVYLQPMYKPFAEEDAAARLQAQGQNDEEEHQAEHYYNGTSMLLSSRMEHANSEAAVMNRTAIVHLAPICAAGIEVLVLSQVRQPISKAGSALAKKAQAPPSKRGLAQPSTLTAELPSPPWEARFAKFNNMTEEMYNELETDNKWEFLKVFVKG